MILLMLPALSLYFCQSECQKVDTLPIYLRLGLMAARSSFNVSHKDTLYCTDLNHTPGCSFLSYICLYLFLMLTVFLMCVLIDSSQFSNILECYDKKC